MRGAANCEEYTLTNFEISTHAPHARRGANCDVAGAQWAHFYSRASCEARRGDRKRQGYKQGNFYSRASCEARRKSWCKLRIETPFLLTRLMRGAAENAKRVCDLFRISTHAPHARRGQRQDRGRSHHQTFLLTRLMRGAACAIAVQHTGCCISTHAPHARRGASGYDYDAVQADFYSRASCEARPQNLV